jgi:hypothetical protein
MSSVMRKSPYPLAACLAVLWTVAGSAYAGIIEPDFTTADPDLAGSLKTFVSKPGPGAEKDGKSRTFTVEPAGFSARKNDTAFDIADLHLTILTDGVTWGDANGDDSVFGGKDNFYLKKVDVSPDKKSITLSGGLIKRGKAFDPLFDVKDFPADGISISAYFSIVPEPSTMMIFVGGAISLLGLAGARLRKIPRC